MTEASDLSVTITRQAGYQFLVDFGDALPTMLADEPEPLGTNTGPSPNHMLLAAVGNCLCASLLFSLGKYKQDAGELSATATARMGRNEAKRLRMVGIDIDLRLGKEAATIEHLDRVLAQFEEFCTVSMSVKQGIALTIRVEDSTRRALK
ncbi:MAG: OsmC family protein [Rhizobacter sp.]|nr:OsmC family protein [Rhizobacter sp.]